MFRTGIPLVTRPGMMQGMEDANALSQQALQNKILGVEAKYAPWRNYADTASKLAYAQFVGPQAIANIMTDPRTRGLFGTDQGNRLANAFLSQVANPNVALSSLPIPDQGGGSNILSTITNALKDTFGGGNGGQPANALLPDNVPRYNVPQETMSAINQMQPGDAVTIPNVGSTQIQRAGAGVLPQGAVGGMNPAAITAAEEEAQKAQATGEVAARNDMWKEMHQQSAKDAIAAQNTIDLANEFSDAYDRTSKFEKGPGRGVIPPLFSEAADTADRAAAGMADAVARAQQQGHITQADRQTYLGMKPNRNMRKETKDNAIAFIHGMQQRVQEHAAFNVQAQKLGLAPQEANAVWINYIKKNPFYSVKDKSLIEDNFNRWTEYLTPEKIQEALVPASKPKAQQQQAKAQPMSVGAKILSKQIELPEFGSQKEFQDWFTRQPKITQDAVRKSLGG